MNICGWTTYTCEHVDDLEPLLEMRDDRVGGHVGVVRVVVVAVVVCRRDAGLPAVAGGARGVVSPVVPVIWGGEW